MEDTHRSAEAASAPPVARYLADGTWSDDTSPADTSPAETNDDWTPAAPAGLEFPGCTPRHLPPAELSGCEYRLEFWDAKTETAWECEPTTPYHERPSQALSAFAERIAQARGSLVTCYGSMDLLLRDVHGEPQRIVQADQCLYLHPKRATLPRAPAMVIGEHDFPDVVLEVDHTTDVRRGKLGLYEEWGFPEVWVQVPDKPSASRSRRRLPGLTIHVLEDGAYRESAESVALPGWTAEEIHAALDEETPSPATLRVLERVGRALGAREDTGPDDDLFQRSLRRESAEQGRREGVEQGRREGIEQGRREGIEGTLRRTAAAQRDSLYRQAERKFGAATAEELVRRLASVSDPGRLAEVSEHIMDCGTGADLLDRVRSG